MKAQIRKSKNQSQGRNLIGLITLLVLAFMIGAEIWSKNFVALGYTALILVSPILVLFVADKMKSETQRG